MNQKINDVEFGAWDGKKFSNTFYFVEKYNCNAVYIEGDKNRYNDLLKTCEKQKKIIPINKFVNDNDKLDHILSSTPIPKDFLVLSVDIDGNDYHVWNALKIYKPIIVIIEIGSGIPPIEYIYGEVNNTELDIKNTTFQSMYNLAENKGYKFICHTGNMIFIRKEYFDKLNIHYKHPFENFCRRHVKSLQNKKLLAKAEKIYI